MYAATGPEAGITTRFSVASYFIDDSDLGYSIRPGVRTNVRKARGELTIYDAVYTISEHGTRVTEGNPAGESWVFMGCSRTIGQGVNDDETLPAYYSAGLNKSANVVNLGVHGHGPHQMLRRLETGRLPGVHSPVKHVVYQ